MSRATRWWALAILVLTGAALRLGAMPGRQLQPSESCPWNPWDHSGCVVDDGVRASMGTWLGLALVASAVIALAFALRPRRDPAVVWSVATLAIGGVVAIVAAQLPTFAATHGAVLWPNVAFRIALGVIGVAHVLHLVAPALLQRWRRPPARARLPRAVVIARPRDDDPAG